MQLFDLKRFIFSFLGSNVFSPVNVVDLYQTNHNIDYFQIILCLVNCTDYLFLKSQYRGHLDHKTDKLLRIAFRHPSSIDSSERFGLIEFSLYSWMHLLSLGIPAKILPSIESAMFAFFLFPVGFTKSWHINSYFCF